MAEAMHHATARPVSEQASADRVTMAEVAAAAAVSVPTVSKVLNGRLDVAAETRRRVEEVLLKSGYARGTRRSGERSSVVDLVFLEFGPYATEIIKGAEEEASLNGFRIAVSALSDEAKEKRWLDNIGPGQTDGVILVLTELSEMHRDRLRALGVPVVLIDPLQHSASDVPAVGVANWTGGLTATDHLIRLGHRRIGIIAGRLRIASYQARLDGYRAALDRAGLEIDTDLIFTSAHGYAAAGSAASAMLDMPNPPTAIFATNDVFALAVYEAARVRGLRPPDDLSVVGFDDIPVAEWASPPLTTMRQPLAEMAALAVRTLLGKESARLSGRVELATNLVARSSTAPPHAAR